MPRIVATATAVPEHRCDQATAREEMARVCRGNRELERLLPVFDRAGVDTRYLVHPPRWYADGRSFEERNREYVLHGLELAERAARDCLAAAGVSARAVTHVFFVTTTGLATPSLDARLAARLALGPGVRRSPLFGLGCAGGAGALVRAADVLGGSANGELALVVSLELCSLVFSPQARKPTDLVGAALFGDGAAAALLARDGAAEAGPAVRSARSHLFAAAPDLMGWDFTSDGMRLVLSREIPQFVAACVTPVVNQFLADGGFRLPEIAHYILHPGGPKVMATYRSAFGLSEEALDIARRTMRRYGNLSSAAVLFMLHGLLESGRARPGDQALMLALGPGFAAEMLVLEW
jgi:alkylresorcinol/alkylpyrone synthase